MRQKRTKQYKRLMALYSISFGFREPYQILVDGDFMRTALRYKMDISKQLCTVMLGGTKQLYTSCTLAEVKKDEFGTENALKRFERRGCIHRHKPISSAECILSIIGPDNPHNYCVATQNESLRERFRTVPGIPLLYINRSVLIVEPPSYATLQKAKQVENAKTHASVEELSFLAKANSGIAIKQAEIEKPKKKKRKGPKEPNPLSCKKKKVKETIENKKNNSEMGTVDLIKEPTNKKRKREDDNGDSQSQPQENNDEKSSTDNSNQLNKKKRKRKRKKSKKS